MATATAGRLPSWRFDRLRPVLKAEVSRLRDGEGAQAAVFAPEVGAVFRGLVSSVDVLSLAGAWIQAQHERQSAPERTYPQIAERVQKLRSAGLRALVVMEALDLVSADEASRIRAGGTGHLDAAGDIQALAPLLKRHWAVLQPLQASITDEGQRLTEESIAAMPSAAAELVDADRAHRTPAGDMDWYDAMSRATVLLTDDWNRLRMMSAGALAALGELDQAMEVRPSVLSLYRRT